jgi:protein TonB
MKVFANKLNIYSASTLLSILIHLFIGFLFFLFYTFSSKDNSLIEIKFGEPGGGSGGFGPMVQKISMITLSPQHEKSIESVQKDENPTENLPDLSSEIKNDEKISMSVSKNKKEKIETHFTSNENIIPAGTNKEGKGIGNGSGTGSGIGNGNGNGAGDGLGEGFGIDWGGRVRKIYNYIIPSYPAGVNKNIDVKLRFSILPDGTVGKIIVIKKADNRLEQVAIDALRLWQFEPLPKNSKQEQQITTITFPFRIE